MNHLWKHAGTVLGMGLLCMLALGSGGKRKDDTSRTSTSTSAAAPAATDDKGGAKPADKASETKIPAPDFVAKREGACTKYKAESNEIKASKVFTEYFAQAEAAGYKVENITGTIEKIETSHGGGDVTLEVKTEFGEFSSNDILQGDKRELKKGSAIYNALAEMSVGDPVTFSAKMIVPSKNPFSEKVSVCGDKWLALFTSVKKK